MASTKVSRRRIRRHRQADQRRARAEVMADMFRGLVLLDASIDYGCHCLCPTASLHGFDLDVGQAPEQAETATPGRATASFVHHPGQTDGRRDINGRP